MSNACAELKERIDKLEGLKSFGFYLGEVSRAMPEDFCAEANRLLVAIEKDEGEILKFNDSQKY